MSKLMVSLQNTLHMSKIAAPAFFVGVCVVVVSSLARCDEPCVVAGAIALYVEPS